MKFPLNCQLFFLKFQDKLKNSFVGLFSENRFFFFFFFLTNHGGLFHPEVLKPKYFIIQFENSQNSKHFQPKSCFSTFNEFLSENIFSAKCNVTTVKVCPCGCGSNQSKWNESSQKKCESTSALVFDNERFCNRITNF